MLIVLCWVRKSFCFYMLFLCRRSNPTAASVLVFCCCFLTASLAALLCACKHCKCFTSQDCWHKRRAKSTKVSFDRQHITGVNEKRIHVDKFHRRTENIMHSIGAHGRSSARATTQQPFVSFGYNPLSVLFYEFSTGLMITDGVYFIFFFLSGRALQHYGSSSEVSRSLAWSIF